MDQPQISVIIPTYNGADRIVDTVRMLEQQTYPFIETVVVIDGSKDNTLKILEDYRAGLPEDRQESLKVIYQENAGVSSARNEGMRQANGEYFAFLDDDDQWHPDKIAHQVERLTDVTSENIICTTDYHQFDPVEHIFSYIDCDSLMSLEGQISRGMFPPPSTWMVSRSACEAVGGFDEQLHAGEDSDFVIRLRQAEVDFINASEPLATYNLPEPGKTYRNQELSVARNLEKHYIWFREQISPEQLAPIMDWYKSVIPPELFEETMARIQENKKGKTSSGAEGSTPPGLPASPPDPL